MNNDCNENVPPGSGAAIGSASTGKKSPNRSASFTSFTQNAMLVLLPIAILMAFALPNKTIAVFQAAICGFSLGVKVAIRLGRMPNSDYTTKT